MKIDKQVLSFLLLPLTILILGPFFFMLFNKGDFYVGIAVSIATVLLIVFLKNSNELSPLVVLFLIYSYLNNVIGPLIINLNSDTQLFNSTGYIGTESLYLMPVLYIVQVFVFIFFHQFLAFQPNWNSNVPLNLIELINLILIGSLFVISLSIIISMPASIQYISYGFNKYISFAPFFLGFYYDKIPKKRLLLFLLLYIPSLILLSLVNARGYAIFPLISFILGYLLYSKTAFKYKKRIIIFSVFILPLYFVISNIGRLGEEYIGAGQLNNEVRLNNIALLFSGDLDISFGEAIQYSLTDRIFPMGGYTILHKTPLEVPFRDFNLWEYLGVGVTEADKYKLIDYGFHITDSHSIGITLFGDLWMYDGWFSVIVGLICFGLFVYLNLMVITRINSRNVVLSYILLICQLHIFFYAQGKSLPNFASSILTSYVIAFILYNILKFRPNLK